ncbi:MAG: TetR/AcrR family transcriptional regulator [Corynebacteriales bacterium]|nr:TetR/AcrR family transcriptional regulator [Mycobacteriales bacterium]
MTMMVNRRERVRAATVQEIKDVARRQLVTEGPAAVSLRAIAREMGMTAPALYRYFPSFEHLVQSLVSDVYDEACSHVETAAASAQDSGAQLIAAARALRTWAVDHRAEYGLIFGSPMPGAPAADPARAGAASGGANSGASRLAGIFYTVVEQIWEKNQFPIVTPDDLEPALRDQLAQYREQHSSSLPLGALALCASTWVRLQGLVSLEVFNHLRFAYTGGSCEGEAFFNYQLADIAASLGVKE